MKNIFLTVIKQLGGRAWRVQVLDRNRNILQEQVFKTYKEASDWQGTFH